MSSNSGEERSTSGDRLSSLLRSQSASSDAEAELDNDGVMIPRAVEGSGIGRRGHVVRKKYVRLGWTVSSSLAKGQGATADQQDRFRYVDNREEMIAQGLADLTITLEHDEYVHSSLLD